MTITQMQYFATVCEYGSISKSAEALHISQPSVSMAIKDLEKEFGIVLFHRENKQLRISQEGMFVYEHVKDILSRIDALEVQMTDIGNRQSRLCLGIPNFTGMFLLSSFMDKFHQEYPDIHYEVKQCSSAIAFKMLDSGSCTAAIIVEPDLIPDNLEKHRVLSSEFVYCVHSGHPLAGAKEVSLSEIQHEPLILNEEESFMSKQLKKRFYAEGLVPNILLYGVQLPLIKEFVHSGKAATFLSKELAETFPEIATIPLKEKIPVNFSLVWNKDRSRSKDARILIDYIIACSPFSV